MLVTVLLHEQCVCICSNIKIVTTRGIRNQLIRTCSVLLTLFSPDEQINNYFNCIIFLGNKINGAHVCM